jgi:hypothetical protein
MTLEMRAVGAGAAPRRSHWIVDFAAKHEIFVRLWGASASNLSRGGVSHSSPRPKTVKKGILSKYRPYKGVHPFAVQ